MEYMGTATSKNSSKGRMPLFELSCPGCTSLAKRIWPTSPVTQRNAAPRCFFAAGRKEITYKDATIYMALRTDRRLIQNVRACLDNIRRGKVVTPEQAQAYVWMILQPYASLDGLCMTLLSPEDKETLYRMAAETPAAFEKLRRILPSEGDRLDELPGMLMEIFIASL